MDTSVIHDRLLNLTGGTRLAAGVLWTWLNDVYMPMRLNEINSANVKPVELPVREIAALLRVDVAATKVRLTAANAPRLDLRVILDLRSAQRPTLSFREWSFEYTGIELALMADPFLNGEVRFDANRVPQPVITPLQAQPNQQAIDVPTGYDGDAQRYALDERAVTLLGWKSLAQQMVLQIPFPPVIDSLRSFRLAGDLEFFFDSEYCVVASDTVESNVGGCHGARDAASEITVDAETSDILTVDAGSGSETTVPLTILHRAPPSPCVPATLPRLPQLVLMYPRAKTFLQWSLDDLSPGIGRGDSGTALLVRWYYFATALLKKVAISFTGAGITTETEWFVGGNAGAMLKIGCVEHGIANVSAIVDPLGPLVVDATLCVDGSKAYLTTNLRSSGNTRVVFNGLGFPLDIVLNWVAQSFGRKIVAGVLAKAINSLRVALIDFGEAPDWLRFREYSLDAKLESLLVGFDVGVGGRMDER